VLHISRAASSREIPSRQCHSSGYTFVSKLPRKRFGMVVLFKKLQVAGERNGCGDAIANPFEWS